MALDRTWYNTLVDDDGSGLTGSIWDKADVDALMDAIDAELGSQLIAGYDFESYTPGLNTPVGVWTSPTPYARFQRSGAGGRVIELQWSIEGATIPVAASELWISIPVAAAPWGGEPMTCSALYIGGAYEMATASIFTNDPYNIHIRRLANQSFPVSASVYVRGQMIYRGQ